MLRQFHLILLAGLGVFGLLSLTAKDKEPSKPLRALLICGGCCHDYTNQSELLRKGIQARANVQVDVIRSEDKSTTPNFPLYQNPDWAKGYDVIIHDECAAGVKDLPFVQNVINAHKTIPAINLHCAMHSFRTGTDDWFKYIGLQSTGHGPQEPIDITYVDENHPITEVLSNWTTIKEELYNNVNLFDAKPLAVGKQVVKNKDGSTRTDEAVVVWVNESQGARTFSTTIGHNNDTVGDTRYLDLITRGLLWSVDKLNPDYLRPYQGPDGKTTVLPVEKKEDEKPKTSSNQTPNQSSKPAYQAGLFASSEESDKNNLVVHAVDGNPQTRWCASSDQFPQWLQVSLPQAVELNGLEIEWESKNNTYHHRIEGSLDGEKWFPIVDASNHSQKGDTRHEFQAKKLRHLKVTVLGTSQGGWASIREIRPKFAATEVKLSASSEETNRNNLIAHAIDGDRSTRWCASSGSYPQWYQLQLDRPHVLTGIDIDWENNSNTYFHRIDGSLDGTSWFPLIDANKQPSNGKNQHKIDNKEVLHIKLTVTKSANPGNFASIREIELQSPTISALIPAFSSLQVAKTTKEAKPDAQSDLSKEGNVEPKIVRLTPEQEAAILKDVTVPEGFEVTLFANSAAANYPVFVAAAPNGDLYVSSDGNGSLGRNPHRGRVIRLRDLDGDGRADEAKVFCEVDSPRGLVWDKDRLYLVHPPHLSVFIDKDGDGVAEESKVLVKDIAFGFADRPADHTTNGLSLGIDGWLYIAGGDFGFMKATGSDGKTLQHRGGGVIRVRPDGTNLEIYATGTRNILEVAISPTMDIFARDNTNDGGGWNVRFHHFPGLTDHGYPRLYMNFPEEIVQPLADYGGGSGCGAVYIDEPGFGEWNHAPFTVDWGTNALWHHQVKPKGGTFEETRKPEPFVKMTRPTDADVDANSNVYLASWKGATFNWAGPDVGYIVKVKPKGFKPEPLPDFAKLSDADLLKQLESPSYRRSMEAQREIARRGFNKESWYQSVDLLFADKTPAHSRIALIHLPDIASNIDPEWFVGSEDPRAAKLRPVSEITPIEAALNIWQYALNNLQGGNKLPSEVIESYRQLPAAWVEINKMLSSDLIQPPTIQKDLFATTLAHEDPIVQHTAIQALAKTSNLTLAFALLDEHTSQTDTNLRTNTLRALAKIHSPETVSGLIERLNQTTDTTLRQSILAALCRLYHHEGEWKGDSWGTRPDTRGPYYQPEPWSETPKIAAALKNALAQGTPEETAHLIKEMNRNRIQSNEALQRILALAKADAKHIPDAVSQLSEAETVPAEGIPLLIEAARAPLDQSAFTPAIRSKAIVALTRTDDQQGWDAVLEGLVRLKQIHNEAQDIYKAREFATNAFLQAAKLENQHQFLESQSENIESPRAYWAYSALLNLSNRTTGSPEAREEAGKKLEAAWADAKHRRLILRVVGDLKYHPYADKVLQALNDPDKEVVKIAQQVAKAMKLEAKPGVASPLVSTFKPDELMQTLKQTKGDPSLGEQLFMRATCVACHTTRQDEAQKGPYLGNIAQTYNREQLAEAIIDPNKSIAQGFSTNLIVTKQGETQMGFVTFESADKVTIRNIAAQEFTFATKDIVKREKPPMSMMPPGLMNGFTVYEFASLLDYLVELSKK